jgi:2-polyprenyl-3-methyl-5-hydroxy-6-metoxy-1,4-benzoquinol methylase
MTAIAAHSFPDDIIRATARPDCFVCGANGVALYEDLTDRFFGASGHWNFVRCSDRECAMVWLDPMPIEQDIWKAYRNYYTHYDPAAGKTHAAPTGSLRAISQSIKRAYIAARLAHPEHRVSVREKLLGVLGYLDPTRRADTDFPLKYLPFKRDGRLLDVGCGGGDLLGTMRSFGWETAGVDFDPAAVAAARRKSFKAKLGQLEDQKYPDTYFDAVVMSHVIEHVHAPLELIKEARRVLKCGGRLLMATPNIRGLGHRWMGRRWPFLDPPRHLQVFSPRALMVLTRAAGFDDVRVCTGIRTAAAMLALAEQSRSKSELPFDGALRPSRPTRIASRAIAYGENLALHLDPTAGEEITLVAVR